MLGYLMRRSVAALITLWVVSIIAFVIIQLPPGDYVTAYIAAQQTSGTIVTDDEAETLRELYGLNDGVFIQYSKWVTRVTRGDFGLSMEYRLPVADVIGDRLWTTIALAGVTVLFVWIIALPIGVYSAVKQYSLADYTTTFIGFLGLAVPNFLLALVLMYLAFKYLGANIGGLFSPEHIDSDWTFARVWDLLKHLWLPGLVLGTAGTAQLIRIMRANLLDELRKPYVVTARAKGMAEWKLVLKYPVRVALNPFASTIGYIFPFIVSGSIIVSVVLSLPTVGPLLLRALLAQDMFLAGTIILLIGVLTVIGTFVSDIVLVIVDPRIRFEGGS